MSSRYIEKTAKFKLTANKRSSMDIIVIKMFFLFSTIPNSPIKNTTQLRLIKEFMLMVNTKFFECIEI